MRLEGGHLAAHLHDQLPDYEFAFEGGGGGGGGIGGGGTGEVSHLCAPFVFPPPTAAAA